MDQLDPQYLLPRLLMPGSLVLPPVECWRGLSPSHAAKSQPLAKVDASPMAASSAVALMTPMREEWFDGQLDVDPETLIFVDETGASTKMARRYGRAPGSARLRMALHHGHWMTTTFVGGLRLSGMTAPLVIDGPMTGAWFEAWVSQALAPTLRSGDVAILYNLPAHKSAAARAAIEAQGARLPFLQPYSHDLNPVENAFAKLKALLRKAAAPTLDDLSRAIGAAINTFTPVECANHLAATGSDPY